MQTGPAQLDGRPHFAAVEQPLATTVLIVDDRAEDRMLMRLILENMGHRVIEAADGASALHLLQHTTPDLILSDILMPMLDGFEFGRRLQQNATLRHVPFVFVTATYGETRFEELAAAVGADHVLRKPIETHAFRALVARVLAQPAAKEATHRLALLDESEFHQRHATAVNWKLMENLVELESANVRLRESEAHAHGLLDAVVATITKMVECRDPYTIGHERRVGDLATAIGQRLGFNPERLVGLRIGGNLHDVGKIALPAEILMKPGKPTAIEMMLIRAHAQIGFEILSGIAFPWEIAELARQHHERLDGSGYPRGLAGESILFEARILAVADVVEAMVSHRPYRPALGLEQALQEITKGRNRIYDSDPVDACLELFHTGDFRFS
jgi:putative two-component system response regulator